MPGATGLTFNKQTWDLVLQGVNKQKKRNNTKATQTMQKKTKHTTLTTPTKQNQIKAKENKARTDQMNKTK